MSILGRALREVRTVTPMAADWLKWSDVIGGLGSNSGVAVTQTTAMTFSAVYAAVRFISETIATLPVDVMQKYGDGSRYPRPAPAWMAEPVPGEMGWTEFVQQVMTSLLLDGNAFIGIEREGLTPVALWPLDPQAVVVERDTSTKKLTYTLQTTTGTRPFTSREILHVTGLVMPGSLRGISPIAYAAESIGRSLAAGELGSAYFRNSAMPGTVITASQAINEEQAARLQERFDKAHAGLGRAFKTVVLGNGASVQTLSLSPEQVQMLDTLKYGIGDVARIYGINVSILDPTVASAWGTGVAEMNRWTANFTLSPWTVRLQRAMQPLVNDTFLDPASTYYMAFNLKGLMRADPAGQADYMMKKIQCQAATPNEWRSQDDENPLPDGGKVLTSVQFTPKPAAPPPEEEAEPPEESPDDA